MLPLSDSLIASIVSLAADAIICADGKQNITFFNEGAAEIFGYTADELLGQPLALLLPERFRKAHGGHLNAFQHSPLNSRRMGERSSVFGLRRNGEEFPAEAAIARMSSEGGPLFLVVLRDVTTARQAQQLNARLLSEMEGAVRQRDELIALVSHDLRNPANAVKMLAGAILRDAGASDSGIPHHVAEHAGVMLQAATQMDDLIQDLLDSANIEAGRLKIQPEPMDPGALVKEMLRTLAPIAGASSVSLEAHIAPDVPDAFADPARVRQVLSNLVGNAIKFSPNGGAVTIECARDEGFVSIAVRDHGVGIAPEELPFVFDRFWQARRMNRSGAGLGLTIARGIVLTHGGRIWIESTPGGETVARFTLPANVPA